MPDKKSNCIQVIAMIKKKHSTSENLNVSAEWVVSP